MITLRRLHGSKQRGAFEANHLRVFRYLSLSWNGAIRYSGRQTVNMSRRGGEEVS